MSIAPRAGWDHNFPQISRSDRGEQSVADLSRSWKLLPQRTGSEGGTEPSGRLGALRAPARPTVTLVGVDIGSTTTSAVVAVAELLSAGAAREPSLAGLSERSRSPILFTPFRDGDIDVEAVLGLVDAQLEEAGVLADKLFGGGALITGLAARSPSAPLLVRRLRERLGRTLIATARDPRLESWLAFMGSAAALSRKYPDIPFLNLDIGGGTTNIALGKNGEVLGTGCLTIGARHVEVSPGTYRVVRLSKEARKLVPEAQVGETLDEASLQTLLGAWVGALESLASADTRSSPVRLTQALETSPLGDLFALAPFAPPFQGEAPVIVVSGGVGELLARAARGEALSSPTPYGDLGVDLAKAILRSKILGADVEKWTTEERGRATAYGLLLHATLLSGQTLHLPRPDVLPLCDVPIVAALSLRSPSADIEAAIALARRTEGASAIEISLPDSRAQTVHSMADRLERALEGTPFPAESPLILLVRRNVGKVLGAYLTSFGTGPHRDGIIVIDEVSRPGACFVHLGAPRGGIVPISFFGLR